MQTILFHFHPFSSLSLKAEALSFPKKKNTLLQKELEILS